MPYRVDRMTINTTMQPPTRFCAGVLQYSPTAVRSLSNSIRNTRAAGSNVTAITCTNKVMSTSGACGIRTTRPAVTSMRKYVAENQGASRILVLSEGAHTKISPKHQALESEVQD